MYCKNCGKEVKSDTGVCAGCGAKVPTVTAPASVSVNTTNSKSLIGIFAIIGIAVAMLLVLILAFVSNRTIIGKWKIDSVSTSDITVGSISADVEFEIDKNMMTTYIKGKCVASEKYFYDNGIMYDEDHKPETNVKWEGLKLCLSTVDDSYENMEMTLKRVWTPGHITKMAIFAFAFMGLSALMVVVIIITIKNNKKRVATVTTTTAKTIVTSASETLTGAGVGDTTFVSGAGVGDATFVSGAGAGGTVSEDSAPKKGVISTFKTSGGASAAASSKEEDKGDWFKSGGEL